MTVLDTSRIDAQTVVRSGRQALTAVLATELERSDTFLMGETVRGNGAGGVTPGLFERFGPDKVIETPVSENAIVGSALGLAIGGMRPIVEIYSADFLLVVANEIMNDIAKWRHQQQSPEHLPITIRACMGATGGLGPEHSQSMEPFLYHAPGLVVVVPGTPRDAAGLLRSAIRSPEPVVFLEHRRVYELTGEVPTDPDYVVPLGVADIVRPGRDVTIVAWGWMRHEALRAADQLAASGVEAEVIDPRTISPFDWPTVLESVERTGHLLVVEEAPVTGSVGAEILARACEGKDQPPRCARVAMPDAIHPYSASMEAGMLPDSTTVVSAVTRLIGQRS
jgi:acetoin:2,6-dichlorophenolindophenol oxidoreductase subunit beta